MAHHAADQPGGRLRDEAGRLQGSSRKTLTPDQEAAIRQVWAAGGTWMDAAGAAGIGVRLLRARLKDQLADLPRRGRGTGGGRRRKSEEVDLCHEEIRLRAAWIRRSWGPDRYGIQEPDSPDDPRQFGRTLLQQITDKTREPD